MTDHSFVDITSLGSRTDVVVVGIIQPNRFFPKESPLLQLGHDNPNMCNSYSSTFLLPSLLSLTDKLTDT